MKKIMICVLLAMLLSTNAFAAGVETYVNYDTREVDVSGIVEEAAFNRMVSVVVNDDMKQYYVDTVGTEADGSYKFRFCMPESADTGYYNISVGALGMDTAAGQEFYFAKKEDIENILNLINHSSDASQILSEIEVNIDVLNIPRSWYSELDNAGKKAVAEALYQSKPYSAIGAATNAAFGELAVQAFRCAKTADKIEDALSTFAEIFNINKDTAKCYELYNSFGYQKEARVIMTGYSCSDVAGVIAAYNESTLLAAINKAGDPLKIKSLIEEYRSVIPFSMDTYDRSNDEKTATYLYKCSDFKSMSELEAAIEISYKQQNGNNSSNSNKGGGGGNGTGSGFISLPPVVTPTPDNDGGQKEEPSKNPELNGGFDDLGGVAWAREAIAYLADKKIVSGTGSNKFEPDSPVTREQFVLMSMNAFNMKDSAAECSFDDMPKTHWAYEAVASACQQGIVNGISEHEFGTGQSITRQDMAVIAYNAAKKAGYEFENTAETAFEDAVEIAGYARESVAAMSASGIIKGYPDSRFAPTDTATRAQAAQIIYSIIK